MSNLAFEFILIALIFILIIRVYIMEGRLDKLIKDSETKYNQTCADLFHAYYNLMVNLFEAEVIMPPDGYKGYRCDFIADLFFEILPDAKDKVLINLESMREDDIYYGASQIETDTAH